MAPAVEPFVPMSCTARFPVAVTTGLLVASSSRHFTVTLVPFDGLELDVVDGKRRGDR